MASTDIAVYRPATGGWYVRNQLGFVGSGGPDRCRLPRITMATGGPISAVYRPSRHRARGRAQAPVRYGGPGDVPEPGNYGDGPLHLAVYRPVDGIWDVRGLIE